MSRSKTGVVRRRRHKRILKQTRGYRGRRGSTIRMARNTLFRALAYAFAGRKQRKRQYRALWNVRISAAVRGSGLSYSNFIHALDKLGIGIDRKILADLAVNDAAAFGKLVEKARAALAA